jgi:hypothetical protein
MAPRILSDLYGTLQTFFRFGTVAIKDNGSIVAARNKADTAYVPLAGSQINLQGATSGISGFKAPAVANQQWTLPTNDGTINQVLQTDGAGNLTFVSASTNSVGVIEVTIAFGSSVTTALWTPPANALIENVTVVVDTAFNATGAVLSVGEIGSVSKFMTTAENDLSVPYTFDKDCMVTDPASPAAAIVTFTPGTAGTVGSARVVVSYSVPIA